VKELGAERGKCEREGKDYVWAAAAVYAPGASLLSLHSASFPPLYRVDSFSSSLAWPLPVLVAFLCCLPLTKVMHGLVWFGLFSIIL